MEIVHEETYKECTIKICQDEDPMSPREWENLGTMICYHDRYNLGDVQRRGGYDDFIEYINGEFNILEPEYYDLEESEVKRVEKWMDRNLIILPLYLYDHSGITMRTAQFSCPWDSGQVGFIYVSLEKIRKEYKVKRVSKTLRERVEGYLRGEVETYDQYLTGDVYGYDIVDETGEEEVDVGSCWGFYGRDYCISEAKSQVDWYDKNEKYPLFKGIKQVA